MAIIASGLTQLFSATEPARRQAGTLALNGEENVSTPAPAGEINYAPPYSALDPMVSAAETRQNIAFNPQDDYWGLPRSPGFEETSAYCASCHSLRIVMQQQQTREGWDYLFNWMVEQQGMAPPAPEDRAILIDYLSREFGVEQ